MGVEVPSHGDILHAILDMQQQLGQVTTKVDQTQKDVGIMVLDMQGMKTSVNKMETAIGMETTDEEGRKTGTGLFGRLGRVENRQTVYDRWTNRIIGATMTASPFAAVIWWLINTKVEHVLKH